MGTTAARNILPNTATAGDLGVPYLHVVGESVGEGGQNCTLDPCKIKAYTGTVEAEFGYSGSSVSPSNAVSTTGVAGATAEPDPLRQPTGHAELDEWIAKALALGLRQDVEQALRSIDDPQRLAAAERVLQPSKTAFDCKFIKRLSPRQVACDDVAEELRKAHEDEQSRRERATKTVARDITPKQDFADIIAERERWDKRKEKEQRRLTPEEKKALADKKRAEPIKRLQEERRERIKEQTQAQPYATRHFASIGSRPIVGEVVVNGRERRTTLTAAPYKAPAMVPRVAMVCAWAAITGNTPVLDKPYRIIKFLGVEHPSKKVYEAVRKAIRWLASYSAEVSIDGGASYVDRFFANHEELAKNPKTAPILDPGYIDRAKQPGASVQVPRALLQRSYDQARLITDLYAASHSATTKAPKGVRNFSLEEFLAQRALPAGRAGRRLISEAVDKLKPYIGDAMEFRVWRDNTQKKPVRLKLLFYALVGLEPIGRETS